MRTLLSLILLGLITSGCYNSIGFKSRNPHDAIQEELSVSRQDHYHNYDNYKIVLNDGSVFRYCCVAWADSSVVFFNKRKKVDGAMTLEPHGHFVSSIKDIRFMPDSSGNLFGEIMGDLFVEILYLGIDTAADAALNDWDSGSGNSRSSGDSSKGSSNGKSVRTGKRSGR